MNKLRNILRVLLIASILLVSCTPKGDGAVERLATARQLYIEGDYLQAKQEIDSMKQLFPKAFTQLKAGHALLDSIRRTEDEQQIKMYQAILVPHTARLDSMKRFFVYQRNAQYETKGVYIPKEMLTSGPLRATTLRAGVTQEGELYIETVFVGNQSHNRLHVASNGGASASSLAIQGDGFNYRFTTAEASYEVLKLTAANDNGLGKFIADNASLPLTLTLKGKNLYSFALSSGIKKGVQRSFELAKMMQELEVLTSEKEKAEYRLQYLTQKQEKGYSEAKDK